MRRVRPVLYAALAVALAFCALFWWPSPQPARAAEADSAVALVRVEKAARRLSLIDERGKVIRTYTDIQLGDQPIGHKRFQGDERTPEGRYMLDYGNPGSAYHLSLHISYPNAQDRAYARAQGRLPGGDIFIHGQPNWWPAGRVSGDWTDGCIALADAEIEELWGLVGDGTAIEIVS